MPDNTDIEAKLCSYIEGDLDATGRAHIEQYLNKHPQYRASLNELIQQRNDLRAAPRVNAPADIQESLGAQLERSALLSDETLVGVVGSKPKSPYLRAWAAIIVLAAALGAVVYSVLPAKRAKVAEIADLRTAPVPDTEPVDGSAGPSTQPTMRMAKAAIATTQPQLQTTLAQANQQSNFGEAIPSQNNLDRSNVGVPAAMAADVPTTQRFAPAAAVPATVEEITLRTSDIESAEAHLESFLRSHDLSYSSASVRESTTTLSLGELKPRAIMVKDLTSNQIDDLHQAVTALDEKTATSQPSGELAAGEQIQVVAADTRLGNVTAMDEAMTIDRDGNLELPLVGKVHAAGQTPEALAKSIELAYEVAKSPTHAQWSIKPITPATMPSAVVIPQSAPTTQPLASPGANAQRWTGSNHVNVTTTQSISPTTAPIAEAAPTVAANTDVTVILVPNPAEPLPALPAVATPTTIPATPLPAVLNPATRPTTHP